MSTLERRMQQQQQQFYPNTMTNVGIQFTNPFPTQAASAAQMLPTTMAPDGSFLRQERSSSMSHAYPSMASANGTDRPMAPPYFSPEMFSQTANYTTGDHSMPESSSASPTASTFPVTTVTGPTMFEYANNPANRLTFLSQEGRRMSSPSVPSSTFLGSPVEVARQRQNSMIDWRGMNSGSAPSYSNLRHENFTDAIDSARGMLAMSQSGARNARNRQDGYYNTHSTSSSISSAGSHYPYYGSIDSSATDVSSGDTPTESGARTLPRPSGYVASNTPANGAQSMMSTFSSKITSSTQKKHRCKICDKRFTRPSSLLTHTYSHTGEKPFSCEVEGCGRKFSVVSNLRRHKKVHRNQPTSS